MKKTIFIVAVLLGSVFATTADAQVKVGLNVNIGAQPVWGPVGYDRVDYYYMPDIDVFYNVPNRQYIYLEGGRWMFTGTLPGRYSSYDLYKGHKVVVNDFRPYNNVETYRVKYAKFKGKSDQQIIRNSHDVKYFVNKEHPEHGKWKQNNGNNGNNGNGNGKGNGKGKKGKG